MLGEDEATIVQTAQCDAHDEVVVCDRTHGRDPSRGMLRFARLVLTNRICSIIGTKAAACSQQVPNRSPCEAPLC